jgi:hypothetical protein
LEANAQIEILVGLFSLSSDAWLKEVPNVADMAIRLGLLYESINNFSSGIAVLSESIEHVNLKRELIVSSSGTNKMVSMTTKESPEQLLFCIHTEILTHIARMEMRLGITKAYSKEESKRENQAKQLVTKQKNTHIFGKLFDREKKLLEKLSQQPPDISSNAQTEIRLLKSASANLYELALIHMITACFKNSKSDKNVVLTKSLECLVQADELEKALMKGMINNTITNITTDPATETKNVPPLELIQKTISSLLLRIHAPGLNMEQYQYVIFGKPKKTGSKVTSNDHQILGTGIKRNAYEDSLVSGLEPNTEYVFSVQQYDPIGLPVSSMPQGQDFVTAFPLPLQLCYCYLSLIAFQGDCIPIAKQAANKMIASVLREEDVLPLWEQNPLHRMSIDVPLLRESVPKILLYELMRVLTMFGDIDLSKEKPIADDVDPRLNCDLINQQIARLIICNKYMMVLEVCRAIKDPRMISEMIIKVR